MLSIVWTSGWNPGVGLSLRGRFLLSRFSYENLFHPDAGSDPIVVLGFFRGEPGVDRRSSDAWTIGAGVEGFTHRFRDTSDEDRHRVGFESLGIYLELAAVF